MNVYPGFKRVADFSFAFAALVVLFPFLVAVALISKFTLGGPVLFRQQRPGYRARPFQLVKFRTMTNKRDSSGNLLPDSQRLTPFGCWLRAISIDELPELINILRGEMSFIGPRPLLMQYLPLYSPEQARRHDVKPGVSGWAQINGRNEISWDEKLKLDVWYVDNYGFFLDFKIVFITIFKVTLMKGVVTSSGELMPVFKGSQSPTNHHD